ncbi:MAG: hypothetical protein LBR95_02040 [Azoarcus sp.]|jgi:hypothetical protein|nr:hypothetical protein [Azoarcus sp.]
MIVVGKPVDSIRSDPQAGGSAAFSSNAEEFRETLNKSSYWRRTKYNSLIFMDSRLRGNDEF